VKAYPAIEVRTDAPDLLLAIVDDFGPTAVEDLERESVRIFFPSPTDRDAALRALTPRFDVTAVDVPDEDWARRSQANLKPVTVGRITIFPDPEPRPSRTSGRREPVEPRVPNPDQIAIVIIPSMGFGTGHHATTRLCLAALQTIPLRDQVVLDVGTGSGVLAIAANLLGAARAVGIDHDPDAIQSARENLTLNPAATNVRFEIVDLSAMPLPVVDVVTANLTGALLIRSAPALVAAVGTGGTLMLSGLLAHERDEVCAAFAEATVVWEQEEDGWVGLAMKKQGLGIGD
jgi:ribosomal protein L11 methyltransferase